MENNKLKLEHLAPYLPYNLTGVFNTQSVHEVTGIGINRNISGYDDNVDIVCRKSIFKEVVSDIDGFKPLLLPLSELNTVMKCDDGEYMMTDEDMSYFTGCPSDVWSYDFVTACISKHFDVFGLIDKGLALNKLTYGKQ